MAKTQPRLMHRLRRRKTIRKRITGTSERPRLTVFRSAKHIYAQIIDDVTGVTLASASSLGSEAGGNIEQAKEVGVRIGTAAKEAGIEKVAFDRNGYKFHGRVKALADSARETDLKF